MIDTLLIDCAPGETRVAVLSGDTTLEVYHHRHGVPGAGSLYRGRVGKRLPDASAVFVDIGLEKPAFMPCGATPPVEGASVDVRIVQPPRGSKGAKVAKADPKKIQSHIDPAQQELATPSCIADAEHPVALCGRLYGASLSRVIVTPNDMDRRIQTLLGSEIATEFEATSDDIFFNEGVDEAIERALEPEAPFVGGGKLIIEPTAALVAIDVDAGPLPAAQANEVAIEAVAREVRMRALAGPMIMDLIPTKGRTKLIERLKAAVSGDPVPTSVPGLTPEGRLEFNRRRLRPSLVETLLDTTGRHSSVETVAYQALRQLVRRVVADKAAVVELRCHERVVSALRERLNPAFVEAQERIKCSIALAVVTDCDASHIDIRTA